MREVATGRQLSDQRLIHRGLEREVEGLQGLPKREAREPFTQGDLRCRLRLDFFGQEPGPELGVGEVGGRGLLQEGFEPTFLLHG